MSRMPETAKSATERVAVTLPGTAQKVIKPLAPSEPEKAQVAIEGGDDLYREIRIDNTLQNEKGKDVSLKPGAQVEVTVEAEPEATMPKNEDCLAFHPLQFDGEQTPRQSASRISLFFPPRLLWATVSLRKLTKMSRNGKVVLHRAKGVYPAPTRRA